MVGEEGELGRLGRIVRGTVSCLGVSLFLILGVWAVTRKRLRTIRSWGHISVHAPRWSILRRTTGKPCTKAVGRFAQVLKHWLVAIRMNGDRAVVQINRLKQNEWYPAQLRQASLSVKSARITVRHEFSGGQSSG